MEERSSEYGRLVIAGRDGLFRRTRETLVELAAKAEDAATVGLTGGSTPKAFYKWIVSDAPFDPAELKKLVWMASDERHVPLESEDSNFGNAGRLMLDPLAVGEEMRMPWPTSMPAQDAMAEFNDAWNQRYGAQKCFDLCLLGMGADCHTASIFPGSPLINADIYENFAAVEVPEKGMRLTITPAGFQRCGHIMITVTGAGKADALAEVLRGDHDPARRPAQLLKQWSEKTTWLIDTEAAAKL